MKRRTVKRLLLSLLAVVRFGPAPDKLIDLFLAAKNAKAATP